MANFRHRLKEGGLYVAGCLTMIALAALFGLLLKGVVLASSKALPFLSGMSVLVLAICIFFLIPLSIFRKTRPIAGNGLYFSSYLFGIMLWAYSCVVSYGIWGYAGLVVGLLFLGVGVLPVALLGTLLHGYWSILGELVFGIFLTFGARGFGVYLLVKCAPVSQGRVGDGT